MRLLILRLGLSSHGVHGAVLYTHWSVESLCACHDASHAIILQSYTQPEAGVRSVLQPSSSVASQLEKLAAPEEAIDPVIESFKEMIRTQVGHRRSSPRCMLRPVSSGAAPLSCGETESATA